MTTIIDKIGELWSFKYIGSYEQNNDGFEEDMKHRLKWREVSGNWCDTRISKRLKSKFYKSVMRPTTLYG